jgi:uncharacterized protein
MFQRAHFQLLTQRLLESRAFIQVLLGPRQVGKSTLAVQVLAQNIQPYYLISADGVANATASWLEQQWELARIKLKQSSGTSFIFAIDEIQKIDNWSEIVKANWDADTRNKIQIKLLLLGSSRLLLQQGLTEALTGRFELMYMGHWSLLEMEIAFGVNPQEYAWFGGYPGAARFYKDENRWKNYVKDALVEPTISRDILSLTRVDKPALLRRLFELGCSYSGQNLSFTKVLGQLQDSGNTSTLAHYLDLLDSAGMLGGLDKYAGDIIRQRQSTPKFMVHNTALIASQTPTTFQEITSNPEKWGRIVESAVGAHLLNQSRQSGFKVYYWRDGNNEVDFVLEIKGKVIAIEVKSGSLRGLSGMEAFRKQHKPDKMLLVGTGGLSWEEFLRMQVIDLV